MLFLGTEKYPNQDAYGSFISSHGGMKNAYTAQLETVYFMDVDNSAFNEALDRFA